MEWLFQALMTPSRIRFRWRNRRRRRATASLIATLKRRCEEAHRAKVESYFGLTNVGLFVVLVEQDVSAFNEAMFFARSEWHRHFFARGLAILLYEAAEDLPQMLGGPYRRWLADVEIGAEFVDKLNEINSQLNHFRKTHGAFLSAVRNYVGAHRDHDALNQLSKMDDFKAIDVHQLAAELSVPLRGLIDLYKELLAHLNRPMVMLRQAAKSL